MVDLSMVLMVTCCSILGSALGTLSGLVPGIHVNTLALALLVMEPAIASVLGGIMEAVCMNTEALPLLLSTVIVSAAIVHAFLDFVPSIFLGAPDSSDALSVLPGHRLLMEGRGMEAVRCSALGSLVGSLVAMLMAVPCCLLMGEMGGYESVVEWTPLILLGVVVVLILSERNGGPAAMMWSLGLILSSGALGYLVLDSHLPLGGLDGLGQSLLFPLLTGLFGLPTLIISLQNPSIPVQTRPVILDRPLRDSIKGVMAGALVGWFPGVTSTTGAVLGSLSRKGGDATSFITTVSAVGSSAAVFSLIALSVTGKGRTGAMLAIIDLLGEEMVLVQQFPSHHLALLLMAVLLSAGIGFHLTIRAGKWFASMVSKHDMGRVSRTIIVMVVMMVLIFNGAQGLLLLAISTVLGLVPPGAGVGRVHLTGCLLVPVILFLI
jgi:putative membrane protein